LSSTTGTATAMKSLLNKRHILNQGTLLQAVSSGTFGCRKLNLNGRYYSKKTCKYF